MPSSHRIDPRIGKVHFPLSAKILLWFFLNLAFLGAAAWIFARVQLRFGLESLLAGPVNDRLQSLAEVVTRQLETQPRDQWPEMLKASAASYHVQLGLYRNDGQAVTSDLGALPAEVVKRIADARPREGGRNRPDAPRDRDRGPRDGEGGPRDRGEERRDGELREDRRPPDERGPDRPPPADDDFQRGPPPRREGPPPPPIAGGFPKSILHTTHPTSYWVFIRMPLSDRSVRPPMR